MGDSAAAASAKATDAFDSMGLGALGVASAIAATASAAFTLGTQITHALDSLINGDGDFKRGTVGTRGEQIQSLKKELEELKKVATDDGNMANAADWLHELTGRMYESGRMEAMRKVAEKEKEIQTRQAAEEHERRKKISDDLVSDMESQIERERIAALDGVERVEAQRAAAIRAARKKFGNGADELFSSMNAHYDAEIRRIEEIQARRRAIDEESERRHMDEIEARKRAYNDLIQHQKMKDREAAAALADAMSKALSGAFSEMTRSFELNKLVTTMSALNANMEKLTRQRSAQG